MDSQKINDLVKAAPSLIWHALHQKLGPQSLAQRLTISADALTEWNKSNARSAGPAIIAKQLARILMALQVLADYFSASFRNSQTIAWTPVETAPVGQGTDHNRLTLSLIETTKSIGVQTEEFVEPVLSKGKSKNNIIPLADTVLVDDVTMLQEMYGTVVQYYASFGNYVYACVLRCAIRIAFALPGLFTLVLAMLCVVLASNPELTADVLSNLAAWPFEWIVRLLTKLASKRANTEFTEAASTTNAFITVRNETVPVVIQLPQQSNSWDLICAYKYQIGTFAAVILAIFK